MPKVSIVLPTYNGEKYLRESLDSVIAQTFTDWELIIVNDCSTDDSLSIANEYAEKDNRIRVISNEVNKKLPHSLNVGFDNANGDYLTWTSDDNLYFPEAIGQMVEYLDSHSDEYMVCARMRYIDNNGELISETSDDFDPDIFYYSNNVGACFMYKREVLNTVGCYNSEFFCVEDYDYWMRIMNRYKKIGFIAETLYYYRVHDSSLSVTKYNMVRTQLAKMRNKYAPEIISSYKDNPSYLWQIYLDFIEKSNLYHPISEKFINEIPEIKYDSYDSSKNIIIFGSGKWGEKVLQYNNWNALYFVDNNFEKIGKKFYDIEIISFDELKHIYNNSDILIVIAVQKKYSYSIAHQLYQNDICNFCSLQLFLRNNIVK